MSSRGSFGVWAVWMVGAANLLAGCDDGTGSLSEEGLVQATAAAVVGGEPTDACDWPSTVDVNGCTGTLIHPRVVTTAAHCLSFNNRVTFTAGREFDGSFSLGVQCEGGAFGSSGGGSSRDWAYCILPEDDRIEDFPITPPLVGCEAEQFLKAGGSAWVVGFGSTAANRNDTGIKREVEVMINGVRNGIVDVGDREVGGCHGDSGGPLYMRVADENNDWGWRVAGSTSSAGSPNCDCTCNTIFVDIKNHVQAIEENEGIDVTPCTDENGEWDPSPECTGFISDPQEGTGTYPGCSVPMTTTPIETCGAGITPTAGSGGTGGSGGTSGASGSGGSGGMGGMGGSAGAAGDGGTGGAAGMTAGAGGVGGASAGAGGVGGATAGAGGTAGATMPLAGSGVPTGTAGLTGSAGQGYVPPAGFGAAGAAGAAGSFGFAPDDSNDSEAGCSVASDARSGAGGLSPLFMLLAWQLRRARKRA